MPAFPPECWWEVRACVYFIHCVWLRGVSRSGVAAQTWADALCKKEVVWNQASLIGNESLYHGRSRRHIPDIISDFAVATSSHQPTDQPAAIAPSCPMKQTQWAANTIGIKQNTLTPSLPACSLHDIMTIKSYWTEPKQTQGEHTRSCWSHRLRYGVFSTWKQDVFAPILKVSGQKKTQLSTRHIQPVLKLFDLLTCSVQLVEVRSPGGHELVLTGNGSRRWWYSVATSVI